MLEARAGEKKSPISRRTKEIKLIRIEKRNEISELSLKSKTEIESGNTIKSNTKRDKR